MKIEKRWVISFGVISVISILGLFWNSESGNVKELFLTENEIVGADVVKKNGGEVIVIPLLEGFSTTYTIHHIQQLKD